jgi:hypothetical protein
MYRNSPFAACRQPTQRESVEVLSRRSFLVTSAAAAATAALPLTGLAQSAREVDTTFRRIATQYIAALGDPDASSGDNAHLWGLWRRDPGPRGVRLDQYEWLKRSGGIAPARWKFDNADWWLEEHGLIMEQPEFPLPAGRYLVTGDREVTTALTVHPTENSAQRWTLDDGATIHDVTHLRCRSGRYTPAAGDGSCSPANAQMSAFPVAPGAEMPSVAGCNKQDYAVLIVIGMAVENTRA